MKRIRVKYTMEVPHDKLEKTCTITMISKKVMIETLRQMAETHGRISVYKFVDNVVNNKQEGEE